FAGAPPNWLFMKTCAADESLLRIPVSAEAGVLAPCVTFTFTEYAQFDSDASLIPRNKCPAAVAWTSPLLPIRAASPFSEVFAIKAPVAADASGSLSLLAAELPCGLHVGSAPGFASAVALTASPAARSTPVSVQVCVPEIVNE